MDELHTMSIRCYFADGGKTQHYPELKITDVPNWVKAYWYTHPNLESITVKIWTKN